MANVYPIAIIFFSIVSGVAPTTSFLLQENGDYILQENGDYIILEDNLA